MSRIVGIDLGTTHSLVALIDSGIPMVLADGEGRRLTPSVVHVPPDGGDPVVGDPAKRQRVLHPESTFYSIKRFMGRRVNELDRVDRSHPFRFQGESGDQVAFSVGTEVVDPIGLSARILRKLKQTAEDYLGEEVDRAVITVPAYFNDAQRTATRQAGEQAGFHVERILNEPTAAALAYGLNRLHESTRIAVYDLGGGTFDLSILELKEGVFQVLATHGDTHLGGDDIDRRIVDYLVRQARQNDSAAFPDDRPDILSRVLEAAVEAKIRLSTENSTLIQLPFLFDGLSFEWELTRETLNELSLPIIEKTRPHCMQALHDSGLKVSDLDQIILVGGQTRMPLVREFVGNLFECVDFNEVRGGLSLGRGERSTCGPVLNTSQNPDEAIALGAAVQAEILSGRLEHVLLLDVTPLSLGVETYGGLMNVIIPRNTTIPVKAGEKFTNAVDNQKSMLIRVLQGERERAADNWALGQLILDFEPASKGLARVGVQFEIDADGILHVLARDIRTGMEKELKIQSVVDVDDAKVREMVEESVDYAWEDMTARRWVESKMKAEENLQLLETALAAHGAKLEEDGKRRMENLAARLKTLLADEETGLTPQKVEQVDACLKELDQASMPLADLMMEEIMEETLKSRGFIQD